ncbi:hypothetical protein EN742_00745 [Mesorhizobium sp. M4A.F.Ca.ET.020.02.1.1]|uniref:hypothetical protein n=1 Tax=Mesorhizobium sp. M4A.F.Ca.ET.020.02.1.1 TaxID=2496652 RepID=UPI000FD339E8|nr:hypothetical protein [Mesorhizobium sp. M4A.F.Ca.ET.020.02.1.1]RVD44906.1 hypothetical protein EN742_00745 [Mesorhizobium sp. M4A.F.Ca.ET.020.02.1.1]
MSEFDPKIITTLRDYPAQAGWLSGDLDRSRKAMRQALAVLKRGRSYEARQAAQELTLAVESIDCSFAYIEAANKARRAEVDAELEAAGVKRPSTAPSLDDLRRALDHAETELACADMIDNQARRVAETDRCRRRRDDIKAQIARIEESP